ncbi:hypothetical protein M3596_22270 [Bacillus subtilis]|uniref:hypothetical protein n=1 Tax=Bacillus subtilis TaxID=1423 RepID=UPI00203E9D9B|nr:hypothetical protein [Bacillus subtilis]MCM3191438.1 hypothetical protein [Bacillus subtilis]
MAAAEIAVVLGVFLTALHIIEKLLTLEKMLKERKTAKGKKHRKENRKSKRK